MVKINDPVIQIYHNIIMPAEIGLGEGGNGYNKDEYTSSRMQSYSL